MTNIRTVHKIIMAGLFFLVIQPCILRAEPRPLTFAAAADMAAAASIQLKTELARQTLKETAWELGLRSYFPSITLSASENDRVLETMVGSFEKMYSASVTQLLFDGGKLRSGRRLEKARISLEKNNLVNMLSEVSESAITAYRGVLQARMALEIKRAAFSVLENQRNILEEEVRLGLAIKNDLLESEILLAQAAVEIASMELDMAENEKRFAEIIGLEELPPLAETIDIHGDAQYPEIKKIQSEILSRNSDLITARLSLKQREEEAKFARLSWIPSIKGTGNFSVTGSRYPLTHYRWSFGLTVDFSMPWISSSTAGTYGQEGRVDETARLAQSLTLLPDPAAGLTAKNARLSLELERAVYDSSFSRMERTAVIVMRRLDFAAQKKNLALKARELASEKTRIAELKQSLGFITRLEFMQSGIDYAQAEIAAVNAAVEEAAAVREVERLAALLPGGLKELK